MAPAGGAVESPTAGDGDPRARAAVGAALVVAAAALWGSLGIFGRLAFAHGATPLEVASVRAALAFLGVLPLALARPRSLRVRPRDLPLLAAYGAIGIAFFYAAYLFAIERVPVAVAAALLYTAPAFVVAMAWTLGWEPVRARRLAPLAMVLAGAFLVTGAIPALVRGLPGAATATGIAAGVASGFAYAVFTVLGKRIRQRYDVVTTILFAFGVGAAILAFIAPPWAVFMDHPSATGVLLLMGLGPTLLAAALFYAGIRLIDASSASMLATIEPVVAALLALAWLGEGIGWSTVAGTAMIIGAAILLREA